MADSSGEMRPPVGMDSESVVPAEEHPLVRMRSDPEKLADGILALDSRPSTLDLGRYRKFHKPGIWWTLEDFHPVPADLAGQHEG
jgi:hypothetical protein